VGEGWGTAQAIEDDDSGYAYRPIVGMDGQGNAIVVWSQSIGSVYHVLSNRYVPGTGWGTFQFVEAEGIEHTSSPQIAVDGSGNAVVVWMQGSLLGSYDAWANTYSAPDVTAPSLELSSPSDGMTTEASVVTVSGTTEPGAILVVNGVTAAVGDDGSFSCEIALVEGDNTITVTATDASGNSATVSREVTYDDPVNDLVDQLTEDLGAAEEELNSAMDDIADLRDELDAANEELGSTSDDLEAMQSQNLMLMVVMIAVALLAIVMVVMYFGLSRKVSRMGAGQAEHDLPAPPEP
jgi:flagellin-like hook-associated protein FlgL